MDIDALITKYGSGAGSDTNSSPDAPFSNLINKYGNGVTTAQEPAVTTQEPERDYRPKPGEPVTGPVSVRNPAVEDIINSPSYIKRQTIKNYNDAKSLAGKGVSDISQGMSATGVGEVGLGGLGMITALPGAIISGADRFLQKASGNKDFRPTELVTTTGLPIKTVGGVAVNAMPTSRAVNELIKIVGKENIPKVIEELKSNPRLTLMDVSPNAQITAQGLASKPGNPLDVLKNFVTGRSANQKNTVIDAYDEAMGVPFGMKQKNDQLKSSIKKTGQEINPILDQTGTVDITPVISDIDATLKPGVQSVISMGKSLPGPRVNEELAGIRKLLTDDKSQRTDAKQLHAIQSNLRAKAEDLLNSQSGQDRQIGYALMDVRNQIVSAIDKASPQIKDNAGNSLGTYKAKLSKYREANQIDEAFQKGLLVTRNKLGRLEDHPEYWDDWVKNASPEELEAAKQGARLAVAHQMGAFRFASRKGLEVPESEFNSQKLGLLFGFKETNKLMKALQDERKINDTDAKLFANSMTAMRLAGQKATEIREDYKPSLSAALPAIVEAANQYAGGEIPGLGAAGVIGYTYVRKGMRKVGQKLDNDTNTEIAKLASATGESREALIKALSNSLPNPKLPLSKKLQLAFPVKP